MRHKQVARKYGVDTSKIARGGDRVGIYYNEKGASQRGSKCIYDRAHSAIAEAVPADFNWDAYTKVLPSVYPTTIITAPIRVPIRDTVKYFLPVDFSTLLTIRAITRA